MANGLPITWDVMSDGSIHAKRQPSTFRNGMLASSHAQYHLLHPFNHRTKKSKKVLDFVVFLSYLITNRNPNPNTHEKPF